MDLLTYIQPESLILIPVMYAMGMGLKKWQGIGDKWIPLTLGPGLFVLHIFLNAIFLLFIIIKEKPPYRRFFFGGRGGIRTHGTFRYTAFRVRLVMTTSILFHIPVSYTHLDVYKRQIYGQSRNDGEGKGRYGNPYY